MQEIQIKKVTSGTKGRVMIEFEHGVEVTLYKAEIRGLSKVGEGILIEEGAFVEEDLYYKVLKEIVGKRAKKRALFLLEQMDRTEYQLREKLQRNGYPQECVDDAVDYVKSYHYIDDFRYAKNYIHLYQEKKSRQKLKMDLSKKGIAGAVIEQSLEEMFDSDEKQKIAVLLQRRHYRADLADRREQQRMYQFLARRGFKTSDILSVMRCREEINVV